MAGDGEPGAAARVTGWLLAIAGAGLAALAITRDITGYGGNVANLARMHEATLMMIAGGFLWLAGIVLIGVGALLTAQAPASRLIEEALADLDDGDNPAEAVLRLSARDRLRD